MHIKKHLSLFLFLAILLCSCGKHRYLQVSKEIAQQDTLYHQSFEEYKVQIGDILYVRVMTEKEEFANLFNQTSTQQQSYSTTSGPYLYLTGYPIDMEGNIELPQIGKVYAVGCTTSEIEERIHKKVSEIVYDSQVIVRLVSFRISIVGEVKSPGEYLVYRDKATIFEALALAGDVNYYADRKEIVIYRTTKNGVIPYSIDLTDRKALSSPLYFLQPNDLIYVQPLPRTIFRVNISDIVTYLSAISSSLALVVAIISLTK